jgi:hypothetical protein
MFGFFLRSLEFLPARNVDVSMLLQLRQEYRKIVGKTKFGQIEGKFEDGPNSQNFFAWTPT